MSDKKNEWFPPDYSPGLTEDDWLRLLKNKDVFNDIVSPAKKK